MKQTSINSFFHAVGKKSSTKPTTSSQEKIQRPGESSSKIKSNVSKSTSTASACSYSGSNTNIRRSKTNNGNSDKKKSTCSSKDEHSNIPSPATRESCDKRRKVAPNKQNKKVKSRSNNTPKFTSSLSNAKKSRVRKQVEYYFSDENLKSDDFYRDKILHSSKKNGWVDISFILTAPRIVSMDVDIDDILESLKSSVSVETLDEREDQGNADKYT